MNKEEFLKQIEWLSTQKEEMISTVQKWAEINTGTENISGLNTMCEVLKKAFSVLNCKVQEHTLSSWKKIDSHGNPIEQPLGKALSFFKRPEAPLKILLGGHMDTVYPITSSFQKTTKVDSNKMLGPGVADMKGGLVVMLKALENLEKTSYANKIGWEIIINPDEEIGSPGSESLLHRAAKRNHIGLLFEPSFPDGALVSSRKGSVNYTLVAHGKAAHAGRDFFEGRNAIYALTEVIHRLEKISNPESGTTVNVGFFEGGGPVNIVPKLAVCRINIRTSEAAAAESSINTLKEIVSSVGNREGITLELHQHTPRPPKSLDKASEQLFEKLKFCGDYLGLSIEWRSSGGVCDGNILAAAGLPTVDTLGVVGGNLHTHEEYLLMDSLVERAQLASLLLFMLTEKGI